MIKTNLTSRTFGKLKVIGLAGQDSHQNQVWKCECSCGGPRRFIEMKGYELSQRKYPECRQCTEERARQIRARMKSHKTKLGILDLYIRGQLGKTSRCQPG